MWWSGYTDYAMDIRLTRNSSPLPQHPGLAMGMRDERGREGEGAGQGWARREGRRRGCGLVTGSRITTSHSLSRRGKPSSIH